MSIFQRQGLSKTHSSQPKTLCSFTSYPCTMYTLTYHATAACGQTLDESDWGSNTMNGTQWLKHFTCQLCPLIYTSSQRGCDTQFHNICPNITSMVNSINISVYGVTIQNWKHCKNHLLLTDEVSRLVLEILQCEKSKNYYCQSSILEQLYIPGSKYTGW